MKKATLLLLLIFSNFIFSNNSKTTTSNSNSIQMLRLDYTSPNGASRELLLGFTSDNSATDGVDYGYDATVHTPFNNDLNWLIEDNRYVIQAVGAFDETSQYLFGLYNEVAGDATIALSSLENFQSEINVYIFDALLNTYTRINDTPFTSTIDAVNYTDRFYITFSIPAVVDNEDSTDNTDTTDESNNTDESDNSDDSDNTDDDDDNTEESENTDDVDENDDNTDISENQLKIVYSKGNNRLKISLNDKDLITAVSIYSYNGTTLQSVQNINNKKADIYLNTDDKNLILHIQTQTTTVVKQIVIGNN